MKPFLAALALALAAACAHPPRPVLIDDDPVPRARSVSRDEDGADARRRFREIEERIARGDLPKIQFEFDRAEITPASYQTLDLVAEVLNSSGRLKLVILAHTDDEGDEAYNQELSTRRAKAVKSYLAARGVPVPSMRFRGYGASKPLAENSTEEGRAKNRRVEFYVTTRGWESVY